MASFAEVQYLALNRKFEKTLETVRGILDTTRNPAYLNEVPHAYADKYTVVETAGKLLVRVSKSLLLQLGGVAGNEEDGYMEVTGNKHDGYMEELVNWVKSKQKVTLCYQFSNSFKMLKEVQRKEESPHTSVIKQTGNGSEETTEINQVTTITEYVWECTCNYKIKAYSGSDPNGKFVTIVSNSVKDEVITATKTLPRFLSLPPSKVEVDITHLINLIEKDDFRINRESEKCFTPSRNPDVEKLRLLIESFRRWHQPITLMFTSVQRFFKEKKDSPSPYAAPTDLCADIFLPILPFVDKSKGECVSFSASDIERFLLEHERSLKEALKKLDDMSSELEKTMAIFGPQELRLDLLLNVFSDSLGSFLKVSDHVERQLRTQIVAAIGKVVSSSDVTEYINFHNRKIFNSECAPKAFLYDIRRHGCSPEGEISIERTATNRDSMPISTNLRMRESEESPSIKFALNDSTNVELQGRQILHGYVSTQFIGLDGEPRDQIKLVARARQFSSFVLMIGNMVDKGTFQPKHSLIISNKDRVIIPLLCDPLPTAKEFRDSIESLSPEQQRFAKAYRAMQLESTLFALVVLPIKSSLEVVLNLPVGSLTKEIKLTQDLMKLFIEYQVPSDLLSYDGNGDAVESVRKNAEAILNMIKESKDNLLEAQKQMHTYGKMGLPDNHVSMPGLYMSSCKPDQFYNLSMAPMMNPIGLNMPVPNSEPPRKKKRYRKRDIERAGASPAAKSSFHAKRMNVASASDVPPPPAPKTSSNNTEKKETTGRYDGSVDSDFEDVDNPVLDYTRVPKQIEGIFESLGETDALRPTTISPGKVWRRARQSSLLSKEEENEIHADEQTKEHSKTMDLLDALSRSGELPLTGCTLHVVVAATQCFDTTVMDAVAKRNINPIEPIERSSLVMASVIKNLPVTKLLKPGQISRIKDHAAEIFALKTITLG